MAVCASILDAIGDTPLVRLSRAAPTLAVELYGKVEGCNPGGSAKDRLARHLVARAEERGLLRPGATLIEASAGNTGIGLALVAAVRGYRCLVVVPHATSRDKIAVLAALGAVVHECAPGEDYAQVAETIARERGAFRPDQFENPDNPAAHAATAEELWSDLDGRIDALVATCGTGGTLAGVGRALRARLPKLALVRVTPYGAEGDSTVEGIGPDGPPPSFTCPALTAEVRVSDDEAYAAAAVLALKEGLLVGGSSGAAFAGAVRFSAQLAAGARVAVILPDTGRNYIHGRGG